MAVVVLLFVVMASRKVVKHVIVVVIMVNQVIVMELVVRLFHYHIVEMVSLINHQNFVIMELTIENHDFVVLDVMNIVPLCDFCLMLYLFLSYQVVGHRLILDDDSSRMNGGSWYVLDHEMLALAINQVTQIVVMIAVISFL
ncbi:hypothetical protein H6769_01275 [Candidatus Peribacteria bacterium]|nr:hypothetical protein [Candidatus Peribacteria bacterium]